MTENKVAAYLYKMEQAVSRVKSAIHTINVEFVSNQCVRQEAIDALQHASSALASLVPPS